MSKINKHLIKRTISMAGVSLLFFSMLSAPLLQKVSAEPIIGVLPTDKYDIPTTSSGARSIVAGLDGNMWFTEPSVAKVAKVTPGGVITEYDLSDPTSTPYAMTAGPDGNLWITVSLPDGSDRITRITPGGVITDLPLPGTFWRPYAIAAGPDANIWVIGNNGNFARITTAGVITEFSSASLVGSIIMTAGPDGNLWITNGNMKVIKISPLNGAILNIYDASAVAATPSEIIAGPDGNMWFTESGANKIARITPAGVITEFTTNTPNSKSIAAGPDGNIWFTSDFSNTLSRITPGGVITDYQIAVPSTSLALGPDNNFWLTDSTNNQVVHTSEVAPAIQSISPTSGSVSGGNTITITGAYFQASDTVTFYDSSTNTTLTSPNVVFNSASSLTATVPAAPNAGVYQVTVTNETGASNGVSYTYLANPAITSVTFDTDANNEPIMQINGTGLLSNGQLFSRALASEVVTINGVPTPFCTTPTYTAAALDSFGIPANLYSDTPPCLEILDPAGGPGQAPSFTDQQIVVRLASNFDTTAAFDVSVWGAGSFSGDSGGGGTDPGGGNTGNPGSQNSDNATSNSVASIASLIPGVPNTGFKILRDQAQSSYLGVISMTVFAALAAYYCRRIVRLRSF